MLSAPLEECDGQSFERHPVGSASDNWDSLRWPPASWPRAGKPTDNPVNEALNGWIKEELYIDFKLELCQDREDFIQIIKRYFKYYNTQRPCFVIGYDTPENYRKRYYKGELSRKNTFDGIFRVYFSRGTSPVKLVRKITVAIWKAALLTVEVIILFHETIGLCLVAKIKISPP